MGLGKRTVLGAALATAIAADLGATAPARPAQSVRLVKFRSCADYLSYVKSQTAPFVTPWGFAPYGPLKGQPVPAAAAPATLASTSATPQQGVDYSGTNVQEEGVDEPDIVKTNGTTLFAIANGRLNAVDVSGRRPRLLDSLALNAGQHELLLHGDRLLVLSRGGYWVQPLPATVARMTPYYSPAQSVLTSVDVSDPAHLAVRQTLTLDGSYVSARLVGGVARVVTGAQVPSALPFDPPASSTDDALAAARAHNQEVVASSATQSWLPQYRLARAGRDPAPARPLVQCRNVRRPASFSGLGMLTVLTLDLAKGLEPVDSVGLMTDAQIVYASPQSLYVATERWLDRPDPAAPNVPKAGAITALHKFDITDPLRTRYRGSGAVDGYLLNQWSLSDHDGVLRVVSTQRPAWWGPGGDSETFLTTLRAKDGQLVQAGRIGGLGKGERVYAVRYVGDVAYVVTFRQVDPLYTIDVADADHPRVLGELKIEGYSAYLHPIGEDLLLGVGQDTDANARTTGTQVSIFDVSDLKRPTRLDHAALAGYGHSEVEWDHHAFLFWPRKGLVVVPNQQQAFAFRVGRARGIEQLGRILQDAPRVGWSAPIRRSVVVGDSLLTVSENGVKSSSLATLADEGFAAFPVPQPVPVPQPGPVRP